MKHSTAQQTKPTKQTQTQQYNKTGTKWACLGTNTQGCSLDSTWTYIHVCESVHIWTCPQKFFSLEWQQQIWLEMRRNILLFGLVLLSQSFLHYLHNLFTYPSVDYHISGMPWSLASWNQSSGDIPSRSSMRLALLTFDGRGVWGRPSDTFLRSKSLPSACTLLIPGHVIISRERMASEVLEYVGVR